MKEFCIYHSINLIKRYNPNYSKNKIAEIKYGLEGIYILITKTIVIFAIAYFLNLLKELIVFVLLYNLIRMPSFGLHANKSYQCLISSIIIFIALPYLCMSIELPLLLKWGIGTICVIFIFKNSPADTQKKPIINRKRRKVYKYISTIIATTFTIFSLISANSYIANSLIVVLVLQCFMISPLVYKFFNLPYNNYLRYKSS